MATLVDDKGNIIRTIASSGVSSLDVTSKEQLQEKFNDLLRRDDVRQKVDDIANGLENALVTNVEAFNSLGIGAKFVDPKTNTLYVYSAFATPYRPSVMVQLVFNEAKRPLVNMDAPGYAIIQVVLRNKDGKHISQYTQVMAFEDLIKMLAVKAWDIIDFGVMQTSRDIPIEELGLTD